MSTMQMPEASTLRPSSDGFYARRLTPNLPRFWIHGTRAWSFSSVISI